MVKIEHLVKSFDNITPINDLNVVINDGEIISLIGPSGIGKSTLLRCINRLETPTSGHIYVDDIDVTDKKCNLALLRKKIGFVFQSFNLYEHMTVIENVMYAQVKLLKKTRQEAYDRGMELLELVGLSNQALQYSSSLSGGQKQRVAIARTLAMDPEIIMFDEPTSALDPMMVGEVLAAIRNLAKQGITMLIVTHEMDFARKISDRVLYMDEGIIYEDGTPEQIFDNPQKIKTRRFVTQLSSIECFIDNKNFDSYQSISDIANFLSKHGFGAKTQNKIESIFEEIYEGVFKPLINDNNSVKATLEYSEKNENLSLSYEHNFENNLLANAPISSLEIFKENSSEILEQPCDGEYHQIIKFII